MPYHRTVLGGLLAALISLWAVAAPEHAWASRGGQVIRDCLAHDRITGHFSQQDFRDALAHLPADVVEYSDCGDVIRRAQLASAGGGGRGAGGGGAGGSAAPGRNDPLAAASSAERAAVRAARRLGSQPLSVGGQLVHPGVVGVRTGSILNSLPTPLLAAVIALLVATILGATASVRNLVRTRRSS